MKYRSGKNLTGALAATAMATLAIGTLPAHANGQHDDGTGRSNVGSSQVDQNWDHHDGDHHHHGHKGHHYVQGPFYRLATADGARCVQATGRREHALLVVSCTHRDNQLWARHERAGYRGWQFQNKESGMCVEDDTGYNPNIQEKPCSSDHAQWWVPFGGTGLQKARFVNDRYRNDGLGRDDILRIHFPADTGPLWQWLTP